ncbi:MAG: hypothetical protein ABFS35_21890 [Bacteroidota bacterium]
MDADKIYKWIINSMVVEKWYKITTEGQKLSIIELIDMELIPDCEFNSDYSRFRKVILNFVSVFKGGFYDR